jgi:hypothetical protein
MFKNKYLKYKNKYLNLIKQLGGDGSFYKRDGIRKVDKYYSDDILEFIQLLKVNPNNNLTMVVGYDIITENHIDIPIDITLTSGPEIFPPEFANYADMVNNYFNLDTSKSTFILNFDFNTEIGLHVLLSKLAHPRPTLSILTNEQYVESTKIKKIIFDSSTFKFVKKLQVLYAMYYLMLQTGGEIYIQFDFNSILTPFIKTDNIIEDFNTIKKIKYELQRIERESSSFNFYGSEIDLIDEGFVEMLNEKEKKNIHDVDYYLCKNQQFLNEMLLYSKVEICNSDEEPYPINNPKYRAKLYYKITKTRPINNLEIKMMNPKIYNNNSTKRPLLYAKNTIFV